jgi:hypothetical protein
MDEGLVNWKARLSTITMSKYHAAISVMTWSGRETFFEQIQIFVTALALGWWKGCK